MRFSLMMIALFSTLALGRYAGAQDKEKVKANEADETAQAFDKIAQLGPGVHAIQTDKKGYITSFVVVGQSRISTTLGKAKGVEVARERARLAISGEFVKWLREKVSVHQKSETETVMMIEGSDEALKESGKSVEKDSKVIDSFSDGIVRGLQVLHLDVSDKDKTYTLVMGWDAKTSKATKKVGDDLKDDAKHDGEKGTKGDALPKAREKIDDKKVTSDDAKKFLPKK